MDQNISKILCLGSAVIFIVGLVLGGFSGFIAGLSIEQGIKWGIEKCNTFIEYIAEILCKWRNVPRDTFSLGEWRLIIGYYLIELLYISMYHLVQSSCISFVILKGCIVIPCCFIFTILIISTCPKQFDYNEADYTPALYAKLQSQKAEYTLVGGGLSLGSLIKSFSFKDYQFELLFFCGYLLLLVGIYYRHLTYNICILESKKPK